MRIFFEYSARSFYGCGACGAVRQFAALMAAVFNLNHPAHTLHWHFITLSVSNVVVIVVMLVVFALAIALPFPGSRERGAGS
jgi:hypothetical protein